MFKRIFLIVLDSVGVGQAPDSIKYGDENVNTFLHTINTRNYNLDLLEKLGFMNLVGKKIENVEAIYTKAKPMNKAKDTLNGHYELMGCVLDKPYKTYPNGFPDDLIEKIKEATGRDVIGNCVASGTKIIEDLGQMHINTGALIIYTSADSVLQIAAHTDVVPLNELYEICEKVRKLTDDEKYKIARIIARPFTGKEGDFTRTSDRHDYALNPPRNVLDLLHENNIKTIAIGKISDIFNNKGIDIKIRTKNNLDGIFKIIDFSKAKWNGFLFANLNDFDMLYGHRRDPQGYLKALEDFNNYLPILIKNLTEEDLLIITADHGNDPTYKGTDHTREYIPIIMYNKAFKRGKKINDRSSYADVGATILDNFNIINDLEYGTSMFNEFRNESK